MLLSEQNTRKVEKLVRKAAAEKFGRGKAKPHYEHGHWWVVLDDPEGDEIFYEVVDSEPSIANTGLSFERLETLQTCKGAQANVKSNE